MPDICLPLQFLLPCDSLAIPAATQIYQKKSSLFHITRQLYSFLGGYLTYLTIQLYFDGVQTRKMPK